MGLSVTFSIIANFLIADLKVLEHLGSFGIDRDYLKSSETMWLTHWLDRTSDLRNRIRIVLNKVNMSICRPSNLI